MSAPARRGGSVNLIVVLSALGALEFIAAALAVLLGFHEAEAPMAFSLSAGRIALAVIALAAAAGCVGAGARLGSRTFDLRRTVQSLPRGGRHWIRVAGVLTAAALWISVFLPAHFFGDHAGYFARLRPLLIATYLLAIEVWIAAEWTAASKPFQSWLLGLRRRISPAAAVCFVVALVTWLAMLETRFGISKIGPFWNPPGVPVTGLQGIGLVVLICLGLLGLTRGPADLRSRLRGGTWWLLPAALYVCGLVVWGLTPMERHYFSLRAAAPSFQPFPFSDARSHDLGALSILDGQGIFFHGFTDRPLYMVLLAILHALGGDDYVVLTWLQLAVLSLIPVVIYLLGTAYHDEVLGAGAALMTILQQRNAIFASREIDSVNPRLFMTEVPTLLLLTLVAYLVFRWFATRQARYGLASGAAIGAAALTRANPVFLLPVVAFVALAALGPARRLVLRQLLIFSAGFLVVFSPWLLTGVSENGVPWFWVKFQLVIGQRFQGQVLPGPSVVAGSTGPIDVSYASLPQTAPASSMREYRQAVEALAILPRALSHSLHNGASALLSLPELWNLVSLDQLGGTAPWGHATWQGDLTPGQHLAAVANLLLLVVGLQWSWHRFKWAGLAPLVVFVAYDLSLAVATTSGGRYIVPVNWVVQFYWVVAWVSLLSPSAPLSSVPASGVATGVSSPGEFRLKGIWPWIAGALFIAAWIPVADLVLPAVIHPHLQQAAKAELAAAAPHAAAGERVVYGKVLYPYYERKSGFISFYLLTDSGYMQDLTVQRSQVIPYPELRNGALGAAVMTSGDQSVVVKSLSVGSAR